MSATVSDIFAARRLHPDPVPTADDILAWMEGEVLAGAELHFANATIYFDKNWKEEGPEVVASTLDYEGAQSGPTEVTVPSIVLERRINGTVTHEAVLSLRQAMKALVK